MAACVAEEYAETLLKVIGDIQEVYADNCEKAKQCELETIDLLHQLELQENLKLFDGYFIAKKLRELRQQRRKYKDENLTLYFLNQFVENNPQFKNALIKVKENIKKKQRDMENRKYTPKAQRGDAP
jgi:hypothetical protein